MGSVSLTYNGGLQCGATHESSGATLLTEVGKELGGSGAGFSPTDLVATALGGCILSVMAQMADRIGIDMTAATASIEKEMAANPRRIGRLAVHVTMPSGIDVKNRKKLEKAAHTCPVHKSMGADMEMPITFDWGD